MKILLLSEGIFDAIGGGQAVYQGIIRSNPQHHFYLPCAKGMSLPDNCTGFQINDFFVRYFKDAFMHAIPARPQTSFHIFKGMDYAAAIKGQQFDMVDVPDYLCQTSSWPEIFKQFNITVDRWILSAHGSLSNPFSNHWWPIHETILRELRDDELAARQTFHGVYGVSDSYLDRYAALGFSPLKLDPNYLYNDLYKKYTEQKKSPQSPNSAPDLLLIGRLDLLKSHPKFAAMAEHLDPDIYDQIHLIGSDVTGPQGQSAQAEMEAHFARRHLTAAIHSMPHHTLMQHLMDRPSLLVAPSVFDTYHLGVLEALATGTPCLVSDRCGISKQLEKYDGSQYFILTDLSPQSMAAKVTDCLSNWQERLFQWQELGRQIFSSKAPDNFKGLYEKLPLTNLEDRHFDESADIWPAIEKACPEAFDTILSARYTAHISAENNSPHVRHQKSSLPSIFNLLHHYCYHDFTALSSSLRRRPIALLFNGSAHVYGQVLLAREEMASGNSELAAAYFLRAERAGYCLNEQEESAVLQALIDHHYPEEAHIFGFRHDADKIYNYLNNRRQLPRQFSDRTVVEEAAHESKTHSPVITFICTTLNAENKVKSFISHFVDAVTPFSGGVEFILVESASTDKGFDLFKERLTQTAPSNLSWRLLKMDQKETIQSAWNRALGHAKGRYINFIGVDETMRAAGLMKLFDHMENHPDTDWVVGHATVLEADKTGDYVKDVLHYDRTMTDKFDIIIESTKSGMVGTLMRKSMFDRAGYFDPRYRCAGDNEHKCRVLPFVQTDVIDFHCGTFMDWPEERATASPRAEIEDFSAWYLFRSQGGIKYILQNKGRDFAQNLHDRTYGFVKSFKAHASTDIALASQIAKVFQLDTPLAETSLSLYKRYLGLYRELPTSLNLPEFLGLLAEVYAASKIDVPLITLPNGDDMHWCASRDNLQEQHHWIWDYPYKPLITDQARNEQAALDFIQAKYRNHRDYPYKVLSQCLSLVIGDKVPPLKCFQLLHHLWTPQDMKAFFMEEFSSLYNKWAFDIETISDQLLTIMGFSLYTDKQGEILISPQLLSLSSNDPSAEKGLAAWALNLAPKEVLHLTSPILAFSGKRTPVSFKGVHEFDHYPGHRLQRPVTTGSSRYLHLAVAFASRKSAELTISCLDMGDNLADDIDVYVQNVPVTSHTVKDGKSGVITFTLPEADASSALIPVTEIVIHIRKVKEDPNRKGHYYGLILDQFSLICSPQ